MPQKINNPGYLSDELYKTVTASVPIVCVDLIPVKKLGNQWFIGIITRATGPEKNKPALIGGRINHAETIANAISRHLQTDLNVKKFGFLSAANDEARPFYVQQYKHQASAESPFGYDPTKNSIGLTYLVEIKDEPKPGGEASAFYWIGEDQVPKSSAFNQHELMVKAFAELANQ